MSTVYSLEDTLRRHDEAIYRWLGDIKVDYGTNTDLHESITISRDNLSILRVNASPDRVIASVVDLLVARGWVAGADAGLQASTAKVLRAYADKNFAVLPLPLISIRREDPVTASPDSGVPRVFRRQGFNAVTQQWEQHQWPAAYETTYVATFWCLKRYTEAFFREWLYSQLGRRGVGEREVLIPVEHAAPWGTIRQRLVLDSTNDASELEGENTRVIRFDCSFRLRTWHFRKPISTTSYVHDIALREQPVGPGFDSIDSPFANPGVAPVSLNLFSVYMTEDRLATDWPKLGNATIRRSHRSQRGSSRPALRVTVAAPTDEVMLSNRVVPPDVDGRAILSLACNYTASAAARVLVASRNPAVDPVTWITNRQFSLPIKTQRAKMQFFVLLSQPLYSVTLQGTGAASIIHVDDISLVHVRTLDKVAAASAVPGGGGTIHTFAGLAAGAYLAVVVFGSGAAAGSIDVGGTLYSVDPTTSVGFVAVFTPTAGSVAITVPSAVVATSVYVQPYRGSWRGTDV